MHSATHRAAGLISLVALFFVSCVNPTTPTPAAPAEPEPPPVHVVTDYERFALYLIAPDGSIVYEEHCEDWAEAGRPSREAYYLERRTIYQNEAYARGAGWRAHCGSLYFPPSQ